MILATNNQPIEEVSYTTITYIESLIRQTQAGSGYWQRLDEVNTEDDAQLLIGELERMRIPLAYERCPYTVEEIGICIRHLADKDDFYERNITTGLR
jgi:hypothetical protein